MPNYQIRIKLESDLCASDGSTYNSAVDTDICKDRYGFPFIPAKRIRGCLRECALELANWASSDSAKNFSLDPDYLFGKEGEANNRSKIRIGNAYLENYDRLKQEVLDNQGSRILHPQNILNYYSYLRTATAIDSNGIADDKTLRTFRVVNKGLVFISQVEADPEFYDSLEKCCRILRHMGIGRTRGLGQVAVSLEKKSEEKRDNENYKLQENATHIRYTIMLDEPLICKSLAGGETHTEDFISGSKILGLVADYLKHIGQDYSHFINEGKIIFSNAYISDGTNRYTEVPGFLYSIKNEKNNCVNVLRQEDKKENQQISQMSHTYVFYDSSECWLKKDVEIQEDYHHKRAEDKGIGRAISNDIDSGFYQIQSISEGQCFSGDIFGNPDQIKLCYKALTEKPFYYLGYSRSSEYGQVRIQIKGTDHTNNDLSIKDCNEFVVILNSPAIIYNKNAMTSTDYRDLIDEIKASLAMSDITPGRITQGSNLKSEENSYFLRYVDIGGYNTTWNYPIPVMKAFDKGTAIVFSAEKGKDLPKKFFIGERCREGFGELQIIPLSNIGQNYKSHLKDNTFTQPLNRNMSFNANDKKILSWDICNMLYLDYVRNKGLEMAKEENLNQKNLVTFKPVIGTLLLMCSEQPDIETVYIQTTHRWSDKTTEGKSEKFNYAVDIINNVKTACKNIVTKFSEDYLIDGYTNSNDEIMEMECLKSYLTNMKYRLRTEKEGN